MKLLSRSLDILWYYVYLSPVPTNFTQKHISIDTNDKHHLVQFEVSLHWKCKIVEGVGEIVILKSWNPMLL